MKTERQRLYDKIYAILYYLSHKERYLDASRRYRSLHPKANAESCSKSYLKHKSQRLSYAKKRWEKSKNQEELEAKNYLRKKGILNPPEQLVKAKTAHIKAHRCLQKKTPIE